MIYYYPINFDFIFNLVSYSKKYILDHKKINVNNITTAWTIRHTPHSNLLKQINDELKSKGYPTIYYCISYIRGPHNVQDVHIDGGMNSSSIINAALNIPVQGTNNSFQTWLTGNFTYQKSMVYYKPIWKEEPKIADTLELLEPHFVRVNQPHFASGNGREPRWIITLRFNDNPTLEELIEISQMSI